MKGISNGLRETLEAEREKVEVLDALLEGEEGVADRAVEWFGSADPEKILEENVYDAVFCRDRAGALRSVALQTAGGGPTVWWHVGDQVVRIRATWFFESAEAEVEARSLAAYIHRLFEEVGA